MPLEIERKYLVKQELLNLPKQGKKIVQAYIWSNPNKSLRIRIAGEKAFLTIKTGTNPICRSEYEYEIPIKDANELLALCDAKIEKTRYLIEFDNLVWELDIFEGENKGLIVAEVELSSKEQKINKPNWLGTEVSEDSKYLNVELIKHPFSQW